MLKVNNYTNLHTFLADVYASRKRQRTGFSYSVWARRLALKSPSALIMIVNGQRRPSLDLAGRLADDLQLNKRDRAYFLDLVRLRHLANDPEGASFVAQRLSATRPAKEFTALSQDTFSAISRWYFYAIRELTRLQDFESDPVWIVDRLSASAGQKIGVREVKKALATMERLQLLTRDACGRLVSTDVHLETSQDLASEGLKRFHEDTLDIAKASLRKVPPDDREISGVTLAIKRARLPEAKALLREFQRRFVDLCEEPTDGDAVYHLETAFVPLTATSHEKTQKEIPLRKVLLHADSPRD